MATFMEEITIERNLTLGEIIDVDLKKEKELMIETFPIVPPGIWVDILFQLDVSCNSS